MEEDGQCCGTVPFIVYRERLINLCQFLASLTLVCCDFVLFVVPVRCMESESLPQAEFVFPGSWNFTAMVPNYCTQCLCGSGGGVAARGGLLPKITRVWECLIILT